MFMEEKCCAVSEPIKRVFKDITEHFGNDSIWLVPFLLVAINIHTWKFPEFVYDTQIGEIAKYIETNNDLKELFLSKNKDGETI